MPHQLSGLAPRIIYDIGANNGDDVPYYLQKADLVVAVEANPILAKGIEERFRNVISNGRLIVENCVLVASPEAQVVDFYIHKTRHILSQFPRPSDGEIGQFDRVSLPGKDVVSLIRAIGEPYYIKIDIENYDHIVLETLFSNNIRPPFISAESHSIEVFALLVSAGRYGAFNLVDGETVPTKYCNHSIRTTSGTATFSFPPHASGPFGEDINHPWMTPDNFFRFLAFQKLGWKDIHASSVIEPDATIVPSMAHYLRSKALVKVTPRPLRRFVKRALKLF